MISTKFGYAIDPATRQVAGEADLSPAYIRQACEASLRRLDTGYIDLYLLHLRDYDLERAAEVRDTLESLVAEGKIRAYGWSTDDVERARFFAQGRHCTAVMHRLNVFMDAPDMLALCEEFDLASISRIPLAMGLLTGKFTAGTELPEEDRRREFWDIPDWLRDIERVERLRPLLTADGRSLVQAALGWIWARSECTVPVPGFRTVAQAEEDARALSWGPLKPAQMRQVEALLAAWQ